MPKNWMVTGSWGQLGVCLVRDLEADPEARLVAAYDRDDLDICDRADVSAMLDERNVEVLVNAAAYNAVDACEADDRDARQVNEVGPGVLAELSAERGIRFVHVSTDYVFDGRGHRPYTEDDTPSPATAYGRTKLAGEERVRAAGGSSIVARTSWVFGPGKNFVGAILRQAELRRSGGASGPLSVVDDQLGCPTYSLDLGRALVGLVRADATGLFQLSNAEPTTWWGFAREILDHCGFGDLPIDKASTESLNLPAPRPRYSVMDCSKAAALGVRMRPWREALAAYLDSEDGARLREEARAQAEAVG